MTEHNEKKVNENGNKYKQLALFSVIVAEVVVTPTVLGGAVYWLIGENPIRLVATAVAALAGLIIAFFRIYQLNQATKDKP